jgi:transcriptional regulator with XRE-family HTH domain
MSSTEVKYNKLLTKVAANLKRIRKHRKLSQAKMETLGFDLRNYQRLESGHHSPSLYTLHKLSIAFKVDVAEFFA